LSDRGEMPEPTRCEWAGTEPLMVAYHDEEWGVPTHDDTALFELLTLEGAQAGLSWRTILNKRAGYRAAFADFDVATVAAFTDHDVERLLQDASIVRNRGKIESTITNARAIHDVQAEFGTFDAYVWTFVDGVPIISDHHDLGELPASTDESKALSKDLKRRRFRFVGPTTIYAFMQAAGLVDDHVVQCFRHGAGQAAPTR
jgi:DNA-3-methyladenine glycosylase I